MADFSKEKTERTVEELDELSKQQTLVEGTTQLYERGKLKLIPLPTADPKDPLNLPQWRKNLAIASICLFGSMALTIQQIIGSLIPVFVFVYAGLNPSLLSGGIPAPPPPPPGAPVPKVNPNALQALASIPNAAPLWKVNLLVSLPVLIVGLSNYILVPASIVFGRRIILILSGLLAVVGAVWAGASQSLNSHLAARAVGALGTGCIESLIPLIVQDLTFIHQRNRGMGIVWSASSLATLSLGIGSTHIVARMGWRWLYYIMAIITAVTWVMMICFVPETRYKRTAAEMRGDTIHMGTDEVRPALDYERYGPRTWRSNFGFLQGGVDFQAGKESIKEIVECLIFPNVAWMILVNSVFLGVSLAASVTSTPVLLSVPYRWSFSNLGYSVVPVVLSGLFTFIVGGWLADKIANLATKRMGGRREPEVHLLNLIIPLSVGLLGCILFGVGGTYLAQVHWTCLLFGSGLLTFGFLTANVNGSVYCIESYPKWAGPVLVNVASFRNIIGFAFTFGVTEWVQARGYMGCFGIFAGCLAVLFLPLPILWVKGKQWRRRTEKLTKGDHGFVRSVSDN